MKIAKIIAISFSQKSVRLKTELAGDPPVWTLHSQNFNTNKEIEDLILFHIEQENACNPGIPVDVVFVNNNVGNKKGNQFVNSLTNIKLNYGKIIVIQNDNSGWSYGGYNRGFQELKNHYDYFIFTEDDVIIAKDNYAKIGLELFINTKNCGFVAYAGLNHLHSSAKFGKFEKQIFPHAHGGIGLTSTKVLNEVTQLYGKLPHRESSEKNKATIDPYFAESLSLKQMQSGFSEKDKVILEGEIKFTNVIYKMGYSLIEIPENNKLFENAYDLMRNISMPWKPSFIEIKLWYFKKNLRRIAYETLIYLKMYKYYSKIKRFLAQLHV